MLALVIEETGIEEGLNSNEDQSNKGSSTGRRRGIARSVVFEMEEVLIEPFLESVGI